MNDILGSTRFLAITIALDVVFLTLVNSNVLPFEATPVVVGFVLLILSPAVAYGIVRSFQSENKDPD